jgi:hypothetical protein
MGFNETKCNNIDRQKQICNFKHTEETKTLYQVKNKINSLWRHLKLTNKKTSQRFFVSLSKTCYFPGTCSFPCCYSVPQCETKFHNMVHPFGLNIACGIMTTAGWHIHRTENDGMGDRPGLPILMDNRLTYLILTDICLPPNLQGQEAMVYSPSIWQQYLSRAVCWLWGTHCGSSGQNQRKWEECFIKIWS